MARKLICTSIEVRLISLIDLGLFELEPQPMSIDEAEYFRRMMQRVPKLLNFARQVERLAETGMLQYKSREVMTMAEEACRGL